MKCTNVHILVIMGKNIQLILAKSRGLDLPLKCYSRELVGDEHEFVVHFCHSKFST